MIILDNLKQSPYKLELLENTFMFINMVCTVSGLMILIMAYSITLETDQVVLFILSLVVFGIMILNFTLMYFVNKYIYG